METTQKSLTFWERAAAAAVGSLACAVIGTILFGPAGTVIGFKVGAMCGSASC